MTTHSDRVRSTSGPIDRVAARVMQRGIHYEREVHPTEKHWKELKDTPRLVPFKPQANNPQSIDWTGHRFGRFTVVGYLGAIGPGLGKRDKRMAVWLVRCACGAYAQRTVKAMRNAENGNNADDCCNDCRNIKYLKTRDHTVFRSPNK